MQRQQFLKLSSLGAVTALFGTGGGSGTGIAALINGTCDVCQSSRAMRKSEIDAAKQRNRNPVEHIVGLGRAGRRSA